MYEDIDIPLPKHESTYPPNPKNKWIRHWANIISTTAALIIAIAAVIKPPDGGASEQVYNEMVTQLKILQKENERQHEDIMALRGYLNDYLRSSTVVGPRERGISSPTNPNAPVILIPIDKSKIRVLPGPNTQPVLVLPAGIPPPLPELNDSPRNLVITEYRALQNLADAQKALREKSEK